MGKKMGHISIQIHYDRAAESAGMAKTYIDSIKRLLPQNDNFSEKARKDNQVYSVFTLRIW